MKYFSRVLLSAVLLSTTTAYALQNNVVCPPVAMITEKAIFTHAEESSDWVDIWGMASNRFQFANEDWNILFVVALPTAKNKANALEQGNLFFKTNVVLDKPVFQEEDDHKICMYAVNENYVVGAVTPPVVGCNFKATFTKNLKH